MTAFRVLVIGLDGATLDLIRPWARSGQLPVFQKLMEEGSYGELRSTIPPMTAPAWTSFMTGKNPGQHGLYDWIYRRDGSYGVSSVTAGHCTEPTLWSLLSAADRRVCVFNVPMTYPPHPVNGLMVSGLPAPSADVRISYPSELLSEIEEVFGDYLLYPDPGEAYSDAGIDAFLRHLYQTTEMRLSVLEYLRHREDWDFFMVVFNGTDTVQHAMWKFMSPEHPLHEPRRAEKYGSAILEYYQYIDQALAEIATDLTQDTVLIMMSDHGFGPFHKFIHVNNWLRREGWLRLKAGFKPRLKSSVFDAGFTPMGVYNLMMSIGLGYLKREVVRGRGQGLLKTLFLSFDDVDWSRTTAYSLGNVGQINLNVRGREPQGIVDPGAEYEKLREEMIDSLQQLQDPQTGEHVVEAVYRREDVYWGDRLRQAPDILFVPTRMEYFGFGEYEFGSNRVIEQMKRGISGTHRMNGILLLHGAPIQQGMELQGACLYDLAPTILHLMGEPIPSDMDGRVLVEGLAGPRADPKRVQYRDADVDHAGRPTTPELSADEESILAERLRNLGYVG